MQLDRVNLSLQPVDQLKRMVALKLDSTAFDLAMHLCATDYIRFDFFDIKQSNQFSM